MNAQPVGKRGIDIKGLPGDPYLRLALMVLQGPHVVEAVDQFYQENPQVLAHGQDHLAEIFCLLFLHRTEIHLADLGEPVYYPCYLFRIRLDLFEWNEAVSMVS
jgi:hypothetical protein